MHHRFAFHPVCFDGIVAALRCAASTAGIAKLPQITGAKDATARFTSGAVDRAILEIVVPGQMQLEQDMSRLRGAMFITHGLRCWWTIAIAGTMEFLKSPGLLARRPAYVLTGRSVGMTASEEAAAHSM